jgi:hypothetical protein
MTLRARLFGLFPAFWLVATIASAMNLLLRPQVVGLLPLLTVLYLLPVTVYRLHEARWPLAEGASRIDAPEYSPWWGGHQCQVMYSAFPGLEAALRLVPGLYSAWLRLWGSRVGRGVYWTPLVEITDRAVLDIGDGVVFGHRVACYGHLIKRREAGLVLYLRRIRIGDGVLLGASSRLGPGARIEAGVALPIVTDVGIGQRVRKAG